MGKLQAELKFLNNHCYSSYSEDEIECWNKFFKKYCFVSNDLDSIYLFKEVKLVNDVLYADYDFLTINEGNLTMFSRKIPIKECFHILDCGFKIKKLIPYYNNLLKKGVNKMSEEVKTEEVKKNSSFVGWGIQRNSAFCISRSRCSES